jgi:hypothetical protein
MVVDRVKEIIQTHRTLMENNNFFDNQEVRIDELILTENAKMQHSDLSY